jgi:hypothetical protein
MKAPAYRYGTPGNAIEAMVSGYSAEKRAEKLLVMLQAYVDDSADHTGDKRLVLAGYVHTAPVWAKFSDAWAEALRRPPAIPALHMSKCFHGMSNQSRAEKIAALTAVVNDFKPFSIECSISAKDFNEVYKPYAPYDLRHPYFPCFYALVIKTAQLIASAPNRLPIDFFFDEQGNVGLNAVLWYPWMVKGAPPEAMALLSGPPIFKNDEEILPLQAADMLAWHMRKMRQKDCSAEDRAAAESMIRRHYVTEIPRELLATWGKHHSQVPGIESTKGRKGSIKKILHKILGDP